MTWEWKIAHCFRSEIWGCSTPQERRTEDWLPACPEPEAGGRKEKNHLPPPSYLAWVIWGAEWGTPVQPIN